MKKLGLAGAGVLIGMASITLVSSGASAVVSGGPTVAWLSPVRHMTRSQLVRDAKLIKERLSVTSYSDATASVSNGEIAIRSAKGDPAESLFQTVNTIDQVLFRPVLCLAPPHAGLTVTTPLPPCGATYATNSATLDVAPNSSNQGYSSNNPVPDPIFAGYPSTSPDAPNYAQSTVLLPSLPARGGSTASSLRYVLGPAAMTGAAIGSAVAKRNQTGTWEVNYSFKGSANSKLWDKVAQENFHLLLGIELDGVVQSAPLLQPTQVSFTSFGGQGTISGGNMTRADAESLASAMNSSQLHGAFVFAVSAQG